jgi:predicted metalloprotease with PDZ domain
MSKNTRLTLIAFWMHVLMLMLTSVSLGSSSAQHVHALRYTVEPADGPSRYKVKAEFDGESDGTTEILIPNEWGGQTELFKAISGLKVAGGRFATSVPNSISRKTVEHPPGEKLVVEYILERDFAGPLTNSRRYRPYADNVFLHWLGHTVWVLPELNDGDPVNIELEFKGFPKEWAFANSFGTDRTSQNIRTTVGRFKAAIFVAGDFRTVQRTVGGKKLTLAIRGKWDFADADLADMTGRVIETNRAFWNDRSQEQYLVTLVPIDEGPNAFSYGGTGLHDSFALFATPNATVPRLLGILAHEYFHNWNPGSLGKMPDPEQQMYWFSEGFTEFYTFELLERAGLITLAEKIDEFNKRIREYYLLPVRTEPNDRIVKDFWTNADVGRLPYLRGFIFAANLNAQIRKASAGKYSLDEPMRELFASSREGRQQELSIETLARVFARYLGTDPTTLMRRQLRDGELVVPDPEAMGSAVMMETADIPVFELGFDFERLAKDRVITGVPLNSAAYEAGLRNGQTRSGSVSVFFGDTTREILLTVTDAQGEKTVRYLPVAKKRAPIPQFKIKRK